MLPFQDLAGGAIWQVFGGWRLMRRCGFMRTVRCGRGRAEPSRSGGMSHIEGCGRSVQAALHRVKVLHFTALNFNALVCESAARTLILYTRNRRLSIVKMHKNFGKNKKKFVQDFVEKNLTMGENCGKIRRWPEAHAPIIITQTFISCQ